MNQTLDVQTPTRPSGLGAPCRLLVESGSIATLSPARRRQRRRTRGAAFAEGVILIFFMIIVFAGVRYLARYFDSKQKALLTARRCAWIFSKNACRIDGEYPTPEICLPVLGKTEETHNT